MADLCLCSPRMWTIAAARKGMEGFAAGLHSSSQLVLAGTTSKQSVSSRSLALPGQITMSRIVTDGGHQHCMQNEVLIDNSIPNLHTFPKELKIFDEGGGQRRRRKTAIYEWIDSTRICGR